MCFWLCEILILHEKKFRFKNLCYLCPVVLDSSRDDWNQVEASKPMLANERLSFWKAFFVYT